MKNIVEAFHAEIQHQQLRNVPFVIWSKGPFVPWLFGKDVKQYYTDFAVCLECQIRLQELFPDALLWPGIFPDIGPVVEASAFGGEVIYLEGQSPHAMPSFSGIEDTMDSTMPDVKSAGLMPRLLEGWEYFWKHLDSHYVREYGYVEGGASIFGPIETAGQVLGYDKLFVALYDKPDLVHSFLDRLTDMLLSWLEAHQEINGPLKRISITDHMAGQISREHIIEYYVPYLRRICNHFPEAVKLYHNESNVEHVLDLIPELGAEIFHFGIDVEKAKREIGERVCLMGAVHSQEFLLWKGPEEVYEESRRQIRICGKGGGFLFSVRGGFQPGTPKENLDAMVQAVKDEIIE